MDGELYDQIMKQGNELYKSILADLDHTLWDLMAIHGRRVVEDRLVEILNCLDENPELVRFDQFLRGKQDA